MKAKTITIALIIIISFANKTTQGQANTNLSNLVAPTAVNKELLPNPNNSLNLGSAARNWNTIYMGTSYYLKNLRIIHAPGTTNFFVGPNSGNTSLTGNFNTSLGDSTLSLITTAGANTAIGSKTLRRTTIGGGNTAIGFTTLTNNTTGNNNTAAGYATLYQNISGSYNNAFGFTALFSNTTGYYNVAIGYQSMFSNLNGTSNIAIGQGALFTNTSDAYIIAIGYRALYKSNGGFSNVAVGTSAMTNTTTGKYNTSMGGGSMGSNTTGDYNTVLGYHALNFSTTKGYNVAIGADAMGSNTGTAVGGGNTAVGYQAGYYNSGSSTFLGYQARGPQQGSVDNSIAIGAYAQVTASNQVRIGNSTTSSIGGTVGWSIVSDRRFKKEIKEDVPGLSFINQLRPVTYNFDPIAFNRITNADPATTSRENEAAIAEERQALEEKSKKLYTGFIAQEVETVAQKMKYDFSGVDAPKNEKDYYSLRYSDFVVPLVKAVQELSKQNDSLKEELQKQNEILTERLQKIESALKINPSSNHIISGVSLAQNSPNPFRSSTTITYNIPQKQGAAQIVVYDAAGKQLKQINLSTMGKGTVTLDAANLPAGSYHYTLLVNGSIVDTKKMTLMK